MNTIMQAVASHPEKMSPRARIYLGVLSARHVAMGLLAVLVPGNFISPAYAGVRDVPFLPTIATHHMLDIWGTAFLIIGSISIFAAFSQDSKPARWALLSSVVITALWVALIFVSVIGGSPIGYAGVILWSALAAKDITMLKNPLRNPFEDTADVAHQRRLGVGGVA